jgi:hypothetical protein
LLQSHSRPLPISTPPPHRDAISIPSAPLLSIITLRPPPRITVSPQRTQQRTAQRTEAGDQGIADDGAAACAEEGVAVGFDAGVGARVGARMAVASVVGGGGVVRVVRVGVAGP